MLFYVALRYVMLRYVTLRYLTLPYITLHYITLHYIAYIHTCRCIWIYIYIIDIPILSHFISHFPSYSLSFCWGLPWTFPHLNLWRQATTFGGWHFPQWRVPLKSLKRFGLSETGVQTPQSIDVGKTIINHPQNHHKWLLQTIKIWVLYYCFTVLLTLGLIRLFWMGTFNRTI